MNAVNQWKPRITSTMGHVVRLGLLMLFIVLIMGGSTISTSDQTERLRAYTRGVEFNFVDWTLGAIGVKLYQFALGTSNYLTNDAQHQLVLDYLDLVHRIFKSEAELREIYGDPDVPDPDIASVPLQDQLDELYEQRDNLAPVSEAILQNQVGAVAAELGLTMGGQPVPPVLYHSTPLPSALIVSPRHEIIQQENISLVPDLTVDQHNALEEQVDKELDVSSLVVGVGGIGTYPTMVSQTTNLTWLSEVVAHEWVHNFLTLRPLGVNYLTSPELRTMNETAASIAGNEIGRAVLEKYYPELVPAPPPPDKPLLEAPPPEPPAFDFRAEMRDTRLIVDDLLAEGKIQEAEDYMEQRRQFFWENGYHIRKLNQAYFAFHGAYADVPGGAAGEDPVGSAVRELRAQSPSLAEFLKRISWMSSYEQLLQAVENGRS